MSDTYDYIIAGAGSSGLSLAWHLIHAGLDGKKMLVVDQNLTPTNDKTWCFWQKETPSFAEVIHKKWTQSDIFVNGDHYHEQLRKYPYYSIRSSNYSSAILNELDQHPDVDLLESPVLELSGDEMTAKLKCNSGHFKADYIFQSCFSPSLKRQPRYPLLQHFLGWEVETKSDVFDENSFILMDFDETYRTGIAFMYVLPWSSNSALLEYTIFSQSPEELSVYEKKLELYLYNRYGIKKLEYQIQRVEFGKIPMTDSIHDPWYAPRVLNLGANAGLTKPSTGYTFRRIQEHSRKIVESLIRDGKPAPAPRSQRRFRNYDLWLLQIIHDHPQEALDVFRELFKNNSLDEVFRFLGEESNIRQDLKIMASVPWWPFFRAIWKTKNSVFSF
ncbi:lycopene cyclase family protein [Aliifodinibius sp. S!AR15-10]|uniref:lycopene cyclase family protein n=1 Tax=Aliifodinibius sp. S!AR15-10 TaxID=2950437 RepID=UPI00285E6816|nr:lycopene cyclase family protein [Aliifodinibius sp. S!AR15-10]MDR8394022.1 lycopene cyclase family protein [Aliifodinibius sp. S!AR15-10]